MALFQVKICGITKTEDIALVSRVGADAIGLNFFPGSRRFVSSERAADILAALPARIARVGVFVNEEPAKTLKIAGDLRLDYIQLHGEETIENILALRGHAYIRAFRLELDNAENGNSIEQIVTFLAECRRLNCLPAAILVDAYVAGQYGGTGTTMDWQLLGQRRNELRAVPLVLAGGLTPNNVTDSIRIVRPDAVDTASGVEIEPGIKCKHLAEEFVKRSLEALTETET